MQLKRAVLLLYLLLYDCNVLHQLCFITITGHLLTLYDCITEHLNSERTNYRSPSNYTQEHYMEADIHWWLLIVRARSPCVVWVVVSSLVLAMFCSAGHSTWWTSVNHRHASHCFSPWVSPIHCKYDPHSCTTQGHSQVQCNGTENDCKMGLHRDVV